MAGRAEEVRSLNGNLAFIVHPNPNHPQNKKAKHREEPNNKRKEKQHTHRNVCQHTQTKRIMLTPQKSLTKTTHDR